MQSFHRNAAGDFLIAFATPIAYYLFSNRSLLISTMRLASGHMPENYWCPGGVHPLRALFEEYYR